MKSHYTTADLSGGDKYDFWHEVVCKQFVTADSIKKCDGGFDAELVCNQIGRLQVSSLDAPSHKWERGRRHIRRDDQDVYLLGVLRSGEGMLRQDGNLIMQSKGSIALYDTALPFAYDLSASINIVTIPRTVLESRAPHVRQLLAKDLECDPGLADILCALIDYLLPLNAETQEYSSVQERLFNSLLDTVLAILDINCPAFSADKNKDPKLEKMLVYARANLGDPDLCPADIAKVGAVSSRTMNRLFGKLGTSPMRWVLKERVRIGERYLRERHANSVTEAAFMAGFNDISHFSRSFKHIFGYPPEHLLKKD